MRKVLVSIGYDPLVQRITKRMSGRKQNLNHATPTFGESRLDAKNCGRYSSRCTYIRWEYTPMIQCYVVLSEDSKVATAHGDAFEEQYSVRAPKGYHWGEIDNRLALIRISDGYEYHPTHIDLIKGSSHCRSKLLANRELRKSQDREIREKKRQQKQWEKEQKQIEKSLHLISVTLQDSRAAGNCNAGTQRFASALGIKGDLNSKAVSADKIMKLAERTRQTREAKRAVYAAWRRLTEISI